MRTSHPRYGLRSLLALLSLVGTIGFTGCTGIALTAANVPAAFGGYTVTHDLPYAAGASHELDIYQPKVRVGSRPIILFLYGGRWSSGSRGQYRFVADALTKHGYVVVIPQYRLYPETLFPGFIEDAAQALAWTHAHAREYGGDPERLFVMGHSAGAHIAAMLNYDEHFLRAAGGEPSWVHGFIGLAGPYDFLPLTDPVLQTMFGPEDRYASSQPINFVDGNEAPALLLHGRDDQIVWVRNSEHLAAKVRQKGGKVTEKYFDGILAAMSVYFRGRRTVLEEIDEFIERDALNGPEAGAG
jgi:acetyl esterase/lipase